ncbi:unnamed protein product [Moneuplotes crassus]|uniref:Uncharacterized protein n=1 Tax=Euplotes crassus TaxID=5936 RepID=A0AAD1U5T7_EUPCR|nr:unnamed protein product [Moneuplotes crassus]
MSICYMAIVPLCSQTNLMEMALLNTKMYGCARGLFSSLEIHGITSRTSCMGKSSTIITGISQRRSVNEISNLKWWERTHS